MKGLKVGAAEDMGRKRAGEERRERERWRVRRGSMGAARIQGGPRAELGQVRLGERAPRWVGE